MKKIYHVILGLIGLILMALAYAISKIFAAFSPEEKQPDQPWLEKFIILYFARCFKFDDDITDPNRLAHGQLDFGQTQKLMVYLKAYLHKIGEPYEVSDLSDVVAAIPRVWAIHTVGFQSEGAVREWCQNQNPDGRKDEVDAFVATVKSVDKKSDDWLHLSRELLKFRIERAFKMMHGQSFWSYTENMVEDYVELADAKAT